MKKLARGFSLAEVLITLTIVGVIAALVLPNINSATTGAQIGPKVGKVMSTLENGNKTWLTQNYARRFSATCFADPSAYFACMNRENIFNGDMVDDNEAFQFADSIKLTPGGLTVPDAMGEALSIRVDLNGDARPNRPGRDQFAFYIRRNGDVIPYGGREHARIINAATIWLTSCSNLDQYATAGADQLSCTGSIIDNGMKALYLDSGREADPNAAG